LCGNFNTFGIASGKTMKFKIEMEVEYSNFEYDNSIPEGKARSMINGMQREQTQWAVEDALKMAGFNPVTLAIYKVRNG
jgi:hypothetical protein